MNLSFYLFVLLFGGVQYIVDAYYCKTKLSKDVKYVCFSILMLIFSSYSFYTSSFYTFQITAVLEFSHYVSDFVCTIKSKEYAYALHHVLAVVGITTAINAGYIEFMTAVFFAASTTNILLALSTMFHTLEYRMVANICVGSFAGTFFVSRICYGTYLFYKMHYEVTDNIILSCAYALYVLQVYWFVKIVKFAKKVIK